MSIPRLAIQRPVTMFMLSAVVTLLGLISLTRLPVDLMPEFEQPTLNVRTSYPGVGPLEIEELLTRPLEQAEHHVPGAGPSSGAHDRIERLDPFARLVRVDVGQLGRQPVADDRELLTSGSHGVASPSACAGRPVGRVNGSLDVLSRPIVVRTGPSRIST